MRIFTEAIFFGNSWTNQSSLPAPMLGEDTDEVLSFIAKNKNKVNELDIKSLAKKNRQRANRSIRKLNKRIEETEKELFDETNKRKKVKKQLNQVKVEKNGFEKRIKAMINSKSWRYTKLFRRK